MNRVYSKIVLVFSGAMILAGCSREGGVGLGNSSVMEQPVTSLQKQEQGLQTINTSVQTTSFFFQDSSVSSEKGFIPNSSSAGSDTNLFIAGPSNWRGIKQLGTAAKGASNFGVAIDKVGNVYVAGHTSGGLKGNTQQGSWDAYLAKYDRDGKVVWLNQLGSGPTSITEARGMAIDSNSGNIYVVGEFNRGVTRSRRITYYAFIAQYDSKGNLLWRRELGGEQKSIFGVGTFGIGVTVLPSGEAVMTGFTNSILTGDRLHGDQDFFIAKYDIKGNLKWVDQLGDAGRVANANGIACDKMGNLFIVGNRLPTGQSANPSLGVIDAFIAKVEDLGERASLKWLQELGAYSAYVNLASVAVDPLGQVFAVGHTTHSLLGEAQTGTFDSVLVKYDPRTGDVIWLNQIGASSKDTRARAVAVNSQGNIFVVGQTLGGLNGTELLGGMNYFVANYKDEGSQSDLRWVKQLGPKESIASSYGASVGVDFESNVFVGGATVLGALDGNVQTGIGDSFVAKYDFLGNLQ